MRNELEELETEAIELILDSYDDIFSDFDPRPYSMRSLSSDFLLETKRASYDKFADDLVLKFIVPKQFRNLLHEKLIEKRLREHFIKHYKERIKELRGLKRTGLFLVSLGVVFMFFSYLITSGAIPLNSLLGHLILTITEPGGWFLFWMGGEKFVYGVRDNRPDYEFYEKMSRSRVSFSSAEAEALQILDEERNQSL